MRAPSIDEVLAARGRIAGVAIRTPLIRLELPGDPRTIYLKLENLQPVGSFKLRGAANIMGATPHETLTNGVYTASAGNMGQGVAWCARRFGVPCTVVVPDRAPQGKLASLERLGARVVKVTFDAWWQAMETHGHDGVDGTFVHPFEDPRVMAGNGTIGLEIAEDVPDVDAVLVPWGGGGLSCGIAAALRQVRPSARIVPVEVATAAPLSASFAAGRPATIAPSPSFVDGMSGKSVFPAMWPLAQELLQRPVVVPVARIAAAVRLLAERAHIVAEGAGAATVAAALAALPDARNIVCVISGGNLDGAKLATILQGDIPG